MSDSLEDAIRELQQVVDLVREQLPIGDQIRTNMEAGLVQRLGELKAEAQKVEKLIREFRARQAVL
jgi:hypothetical protein